MDNLEIHFKYLQKLIERESFLEKEMIEAEVHYLESRTIFFDKLTILAAGTLAVAIPFLAAAFQSASLRLAINHNIILLSAALFTTGLSLICCVLHNSAISRSVRFLSEQIESTYKAAHALTAFREKTPSSNMFTCLPSKEYDVIKGHERHGEDCNVKKRKATKFAEWTGVPALLFLISSYVLGICAVVSIMTFTGDTTFPQKPNQSVVTDPQPKATQQPPASGTVNKSVSNPPVH